MKGGREIDTVSIFTILFSVNTLLHLDKLKL